MANDFAVVFLSDMRCAAYMRSSLLRVQGVTSRKRHRDRHSKLHNQQRLIMRGTIRAFSGISRTDRVEDRHDSAPGCALRRAAQAVSARAWPHAGGAR